MLYTELVKRASTLAGLEDFFSDSMGSDSAARAFEILQTSLLALNTDDRLTFAVDDISVPLVKPRLVLTPNRDYEPKDNEQVLYTDYPVEIAPAYVIGHPATKMQQVQYETFITDRSSIYNYALRVEYGKATLFFYYSGELNIGLKKPLDMPKVLTDDVKLIGSTLNLLVYKLATEICAFSGFAVSQEVEKKYAEAIARHAKNKTDILAPPAL
jgi:hypothetical protein